MEDVMNNISKILLFLSLPIVISACATTQKAAETPKVNKVEVECKAACDVMEKCSTKMGARWSHGERMDCREGCLQTDPVLRTAISICAIKVLSKNCNSGHMKACVGHQYRRLKTGQ